MTSAESRVEGIYEVCIGVEEPIAAIQYWQQFGYRIGQMGELDAERAIELYGVNSSVRSIRLIHQTADHGLIRLMVWGNPTNEGLDMTSMRAKGNDADCRSAEFAQPCRSRAGGGLADSLQPAAMGSDRSQGAIDAAVC